MNRYRLVSIIVVICALTGSPGCTIDERGDVTSTAVQDFGLTPDVAVPLLGVGVPPSSGTAGDGGGSGRISVTSGWSGGPGAVTVYGEQLVIPLNIRQGAVIASTTCDIWNPGPGVIVTYELWGFSGVIASTTVPSSTSVVFRSWLMPTGAGAVANDGGQYTLKLTPKNADGSWTTSAAPVTVISCAVNAISTIPMSAASCIATDPVKHPLTYGFGTATGANFACLASVPVPVGHTISAVRATVQDSATDQNAKMVLQLSSINSNNGNVIASSPVSAGNGGVQTLTIAPATIVQPHTAYQLLIYAVGQPSASVSLWFAEVDYN